MIHGSEFHDGSRQVSALRLISALGTPRGNRAHVRITGSWKKARRYCVMLGELRNRAVVMFGAVAYEREVEIKRRQDTLRTAKLQGIHD